ncbi:MAG TPA: hypothetical protein VGF67_21035 [Ktedonobacteraceae bacterium]
MLFSALISAVTAENRTRRGQTDWHEDLHSRRPVFWPAACNWPPATALWWRQANHALEHLALTRPNEARTPVVSTSVRSPLLFSFLCQHQFCDCEIHSRHFWQDAASGGVLLSDSLDLTCLWFWQCCCNPAIRGRDCMDAIPRLLNRAPNAITVISLCNELQN